MITRSSMKLLRISVKYASLFNVIPYQWDDESDRLQNCTSCFKWNVTKYLVWFHQLFCTSRVLESIVKNNQSFTESINLIGYVSLFLLPTAIQTVLHVRRLEILHFVNNYIQFFAGIVEKFARVDEPEARHGLEPIIKMFFAMGVVIPVLSVSFYCNNPSTVIFMSSLLAKEEHTGVLLTLLGLLELWFNFIGWTSVIIFSAIIFTFIYASIFLANELKPNEESIHTVGKLRQPKIAIEVYRGLQLLTNSLNEITRELFVILNDFTLCGTVLVNFMIIRSPYNLFPDTCLMKGIWMTSSSSGTVNLILLNVKLGDVHNSAVSLLAVWKRNLKILPLEPIDRRVIQMYLRSCRTMRVEFSGFGHFHKCRGLQVGGKLLWYTLKFLVVMK